MNRDFKKFTAEALDDTGYSPAETECLRGFALAFQKLRALHSREVIALFNELSDEELAGLIAGIESREVGPMNIWEHLGITSDE